MKQTLKSISFLIFFLILIFCRSISVANATSIFVGGADLSPSYIGQDGTPFAIHYSVVAGLERNAEYFIKVRIKSSSSYYGSTWNEDSNAWVAQNTSWDSFPKILTDDSGKASGLLFGKNSSAPVGQCTLQLVVRKVGSNINIESSITPMVTVVNMENTGGWLAGHVKNQGSIYENALILLKDKDNNVIGSYISEDNNIDEGYSSGGAGFVKIATLAGLDCKIEAYDINDLTNPIWVSSETYSIKTGEITYIDPNQPPTAEAGNNQNVTLGQTVNFDASGSCDSDGTIDSYSWDFDGDGEEDSNQVNPQYTYDTVGQFTATVTVTDDSGSISSDQAIINVSWPTYSSNIFINELLPNPSGDETTDEYVELFNNGNAAVDLVGWKVADASGSYYIISKKNYNSTVIPAKGYFTLYRNVTGVSLNNSGGEQIFFYSPDGNQKNSVSYSGSVSEDYSYNRTNNGWQWSTTSTPGSGNIITEEDPSNSSSSVKKAKTIKASSTKTSSGSTGSVLGVKKAQAAGNSSSHHFSENEDSEAVSASDRWRIFIWLLMIGAFAGLIVFRLLLWRKDRYKNDTIYQ